MKITILQRNIEWANPQANIARADEAISCLLDADLFVLPEMFSTGFCTQPEGIAESADSETLHWMKRKAAERNCAIAGSVAVCENGNYYNRFYFVHPDGAVQHYDKKHLFTFGGEHKRFTAGTERVVVSQLIRSAGVFFTPEKGDGKDLYSAKLIPGRGAWLEFETSQSGAIYVKIDRRRKIAVKVVDIFGNDTMTIIEVTVGGKN